MAVAPTLSLTFCAVNPAGEQKLSMLATAASWTSSDDLAPEPEYASLSLCSLQHIPGETTELGEPKPKTRFRDQEWEQAAKQGPFQEGWR